MWVWIKDRFCNLDTGACVRIRTSKEAESEPGWRPAFEQVVPDVIVKLPGGNSETYTMEAAELLMSTLAVKVSEDNIQSLALVMLEQMREFLLATGYNTPEELGGN